MNEHIEPDPTRNSLNHKQAVEEIENIIDEIKVKDESASNFVLGTLISFLDGSLTQSEALRRARMIRDKFK